MYVYSFELLVNNTIFASHSHSLSFYICTPSTIHINFKYITDLKGFGANRRISVASSSNLYHFTFYNLLFLFINSHLHILCNNAEGSITTNNNRSTFSFAFTLKYFIH